MEATTADQPGRTMSGEELTHGFYNLMGLQQRDAKWVASIAESTHDNAVVLNQVIERLNLTESARNLTQEAFARVKSELDALISDTRTALEKVDDKHTSREIVEKHSVCLAEDPPH